MKEALETRLLEKIRMGKNGFYTLPLSWVYALAVRGRHWLYDNRMLVQKHAPLPVVSIGNLVVGGVGKTQVALLLAQSVENAAILTRGFRGKAEKGKRPLHVSIEKHTADLSGDEPWLLASRLPNTPVIVNRDRYKSSLEAEKLGARVILLDDGMQHRQLFRNYEIVVINGSDPFGGGHFLPRGLLREDPKRLARADLIVSVGKLKKALPTNIEAPIVETEVRVRSIRDLSGAPIASLQGKRVGIFCGIGNPGRFVESVKALGADVVASHFLPDHKTIDEKVLKKFAQLCKEQGAEYLLCTEKDRVKLQECAKECALPIGWVEVELEIVKNRAAWDRMTKEIRILAGIAR